jgi:ATP-dependent DNA helicase RecG
MSRLLQGDVGSGKTAVAVAACAAVAQAGHQAAIMAPTEILAEQHARVALETLSAAGFRVGLLTGNVAGSERRRILEDLAVGRIQVIVGTHALIQEEVHFARLALGIVDEQHRFGVRQRARIVELGREGLGRTPHMLVMTATPIPRTLALTVYGDLDLSLLDELPPGRTPVATRLFGDKQREQAYSRVRTEVERGRQAYVVFPLVEGSDAEGLERIRDATSSAEALANGPLAGLTVGLLHGRMGGDEKDATMRRFIAGEIQVLVSTTVIEVGIDVPNATVMVIEHAERFGLSQLHQLRGRVGRGEHESVCLLLSHYTPSEDAWRRLKVMEKTNDGFLIAEEDLAIRGPGDFLGTRQSGMPLLAVANLARDQRILQQAREDAADLLNRDPDLEAEEHRALRGSVATAWQERLALAQIG